MPQVDILTFFPQIFWFTLLFFIFFLFFSYWGIKPLNLTQKARTWYLQEQLQLNQRNAQTFQFQKNRIILLKMLPYLTLKKKLIKENLINKKIEIECVNFIKQKIYTKNLLLFLINIKYNKLVKNTN